MKLIKPSFEILEQGLGLQGIYKQIELAGRTCYKSLDKITEDSAKDFVDRMITSLHLSMLEHGTVYLRIPQEVIWGFYGNSWSTDYPPYKGDYFKNPYSKVVVKKEYVTVNEGENAPTDTVEISVLYITTNYRVLIENDWLGDIQYLCEPTEHHEKRVTVRFTTDRGVSHEFVRHRVFSFAQESTRYCNYSKDKFGNEITFIAPSWVDDTDIENIPLYLHGEEYMISFGAIHLVNALSQCESCYISMIREGATPQQARQVLPNALKTELVMTGFVSDWQHFFRLRTSIIAETGKPHPDASALADPLMNEFYKRNIITK